MDYITNITGFTQALKSLNSLELKSDFGVWVVAQFIKVFEKLIKNYLIKKITT